MSLSSARKVSWFSILFFVIGLLLLAPGCDGETSSQPEDTAQDTGQDVQSDIQPDEQADQQPDPETETEQDTTPDTEAADDSIDVELPPGVQCTGTGECITDVRRTPTNVHLTWQRDPATTITLQWMTEDMDTETYLPKVWFAEDDPALVRRVGDGVEIIELTPDMVSEGEGTIYEAEMGGVVVGEYVNWAVELTGLEPETTYYYRAGSWDSYDDASDEFQGVNLSPVYSFSTAREKGSREPLRFVAAGDSRGGYDEIAEQIDRLAALDAGFWLFSGDMTDVGTMGEWNLWFEAMSPVMVDTVLMPIQGNHETLVEVYYGQFALPRMEGLDEELHEHAYSFDYQNVHVVGLNSCTAGLVRAQVDWLTADLAAAAQDADIDWIVVFFHHPAYSACSHGPTDYVLEHWVPIFEAHGVDVVFNGHDHDYERTHPIRGGEVVDEGEGVVYVVAGAFFAPGYGNGSEWWTVTSTHGDKANYAVVDIEGNTLHAVAYSGDGNEVLDEFTMTK